MAADISAANTLIFQFSVDGTEVAATETRREYTASQDIGTVVLDSLLNLALNEVLTIEVKSASSTPNMTVIELNWVVTQV